MPRITERVIPGSEPQRPPGSRLALGIVFLTVLIDLVGFGIVLPLLPFYATSMGASALDVGIIIASYSAMQFLFSPIWGSLSDRIGRRPLILLGLLGSGASYIVFALAQTIGVLLLSRVVAGITGATIPVAQAFIADTTTRERRARGMGMLGAAFGLGFILGPAIGGLLSPWGYALPGFVAAGMSLSSAAAAFFFLPESLPPGARRTSRRAGARALIERMAAARRILARPRLRDPIGAFFVGTLGFAAFTTTFPLFLDEPLGLGPVHAGGMFALVGVISATTQGALIGPLSERFGERAIAACGAVLLGAGLLLMAWFSTLAWVLVLLGLVASGWGLLAPTLQSLVSRGARADEQGEALGVNQSMSSLARVIGPIAGGWAFGAFGFRAQFAGAGVLVALTAVWVQRMRKPARAGRPDRSGINQA